MSSAPATEFHSCAERVHESFRGSTEFAKWLRVFAFITEAAAALIAALRIMFPDMPWPGWASLVLALIVLAGVIVHTWAKVVLSYSEKCRRVAIRAYATGKDISQARASSLLFDAPSLTVWFAKSLPTSSLHEYYESERPPGSSRLRELYAHSAFYTWKLRRVCWRINVYVAIAFTLLGFLIVYAVATTANEPTNSDRLLDLVCSIIFVFLAAKTAVAAIDLRQSYSECRRIAESLLMQKSEDDPSEQAIEYDIEMASGITIPTFLYRRMRSGLQRDWSELKSGLP